MIVDLLKKNRSYRRFDTTRDISRELLLSFVESVRYTASGANLQRLRFTVINEKNACDDIFSSLKFAGYLKEWKGPSETERPVAYIIVSSETELDTLLAIDLGISAEAILLTASEAGVGGCMFRSYNAEKIKAHIPADEQNPCLVIALGYPAEKVYITDVKNGDIKYYRDEQDNHLVPKLSLEELVLN
ncbi:MAG: nitroreductase family protein [Clostridia bacterium]|nr:nitroreductase family protein [Clostridia bacterium]